MKPNLIWHYTIAATLLEIVESGVIKTQSGKLPAGTKPVVWFSTNPKWEQTATKMVGIGGHAMPLASFENMLRHAETRNPVFTPARIGVDESVAPGRWKGYKESCGAPYKFTKALYEYALEVQASPSEWRWTANEVPSSAWRSIEIYKGGVWTTVTRAELEPYRDKNPALDL